MKNYFVAQYRNQCFDAVISGLGRNKGTLDSMHSKKTAKRWARELNADPARANKGFYYKVESI